MIVVNFVEIIAMSKTFTTKDTKGNEGTASDDSLPYEFPSWTFVPLVVNALVSA